MISMALKKQILCHNGEERRDIGIESHVTINSHWKLFEPDPEESFMRLESRGQLWR